MLGVVLGIVVDATLTVIDTGVAAPQEANCIVRAKMRNKNDIRCEVFIAVQIQIDK
jgi:hypothetical protein